MSQLGQKIVGIEFLEGMNLKNRRCWLESGIYMELRLWKDLVVGNNIVSL